MDIVIAGYRSCKFPGVLDRMQLITRDYVKSREKTCPRLEATLPMNRAVPYCRFCSMRDDSLPLWPYPQLSVYKSSFPPPLYTLRTVPAARSLRREELFLE